MILSHKHNINHNFYINFLIFNHQEFIKIKELTDVSEGSIVRCITRLDETCREVKSAARIIGDSSLFNKMEEAQQRIKRDIVFAKSLVSDKKFSVSLTLTFL